jgi:NhaA family Na+:H+ antiporter
MKVNLLRRLIGSKQLMKSEAMSGLFLMMSALLAIVVANSGMADWYNGALNQKLQLSYGDWSLGKSLLYWINDGLMAVFFLLIGLEVKRELVDGNLSTPSQMVLPGLAAIGGMVVPGVIFYLINQGQPQNMAGWAIPVATDIAFALGVLALVGSRAPIALKVLLTAIAIIDDIAAILIIAIFYTSQLSIDALAMAGVFFVALVVMNRLGVRRLGLYLLLGFFVWYFMLKSGVHATLAGVLVAFTIPLKIPEAPSDIVPPLIRLEHNIYPYVGFLILPIFGFANAGVTINGVGLSQLFDPLPLGIFIGLFFGKQLGVFGALWAAIKLGLAKMPRETGWAQLYAVSLLCGIGFTMSLFIGLLAFDDQLIMNQVRLGVIGASVLSAVIAFVILRYGPRGHIDTPTEKIEKAEADGDADTEAKGQATAIKPSSSSPNHVNKS